MKPMHSGIDKRHASITHRHLEGKFPEPEQSLAEALESRGGHAWMEKGVAFLDEKLKTVANVDADAQMVKEGETGHIKVMQTSTGGKPMEWYKYGVIHKVLKKGAGVHHPMPDAYCKVHYEGKLYTGEAIVNASTYDGEPHIMQSSHFAIDWEHPDLIDHHHSSTSPGYLSHRRIEGAFEALTHMHEGDEWELYLSPDMGFHIPGVPQAGIPPASVLIFKLKLVEIMEGSTKTHLKPHPIYGAQHPNKDKDWKTRPENEGVNSHLDEKGRPYEKTDL